VGGGVIVPQEFERSVISLAANASAMRQLATVIVNTNDRSIPIESDPGSVGATAEDAAYAEGDATLGTKNLKSYKLTKQLTLSEELFQDANFVVQYLQNNFGLLFGAAEEEWFVTGAGSTEPEGAVTGASAGNTTASATAITPQEILDLMGTLKAAYDSNASFLMQKSTAIALRKQQITDNQFLAYFGSANGRPTLFEKPVFYSDAIDAIGAGNQPVVYGDFRQGYLIGDRSQISFKVLDQPKATEGKLIVIGNRRVDGLVQKAEALKVLSCHA
jgi:HK97 family phage major capsid protein